MLAKIGKGPLLGQRHLQILLLFLAIVVNYITKFNVGVAVVAMTDAATTNPNFPEYNWNEMERSFVLSSFFWGYFLSQFPGSYLCSRFGAKLTMFISTLCSSVVILLPPLCVSWGGWKIYCAIRVIQGIFQGALFPGIHAHLASWCPVNERNRLGALTYTGVECGTVLAMFLSGSLAASPMGWPSIFYFSGGLGIIWCIFWWIFASNSPNESKLISPEEVKYIERSKSEQATITTTSKNSIEVKENEGESKIPVPWRAIMTSLPFWAIVSTFSAQSWGFTTIQAEIPSYMNGVLRMDMKSNALFSALPYLAMWCMSYFYMILADILLNRGWLSLNAVRKTFNSVALFGEALCLIAVGFLSVEQKTLAIVLMTTSVGIDAGTTIGGALNTIDLSPNHAAIIMGVANTGANIIAILTPLIVGLIVKNQHDRAEWQIVFIISAAVLALGNLFYICLGSTKLQPWDDKDFLAKKKDISFEREKDLQIESLGRDRGVIEEKYVRISAN